MKIPKKEHMLEYWNKVVDTISYHLRLKILAMIALSFMAASMAYGVVDLSIRHTPLGTYEYVTFENYRLYTQNTLLSCINELNSKLNTNRSNDVSKEGEATISEETAHKIKSIISNYREYLNSNSERIDINLLDVKGNNILQDNIIERYNLAKIIEEANNERDDARYISIYPVLIQGNIYYLYSDIQLEPEHIIQPNRLGKIVGFISALGVFTFLMYLFTKERMEYLEYLSLCLNEISKGNLNYQIDIIGKDELANVASSITHMEKELQAQINEKMQTERSKNELVSNVAHDLRTPLTSIIGYIGLVKNKSFRTQEEEEKYLAIAYTKSEKLKVLIEDLFELTKLHQRAVQFKKDEISLSNLLNQLIEELMPLADEQNIKIETHIEPTNALVEVDILKMTRVFENLIENAIKYSEKGDTIYIELREFKKKIYVAISNPCTNFNEEELDHIFERFYRTDKSRNSETGGSGLGLAIAKNIVELHQGTISAKLYKGLICFKIGIPKKVKDPFINI